jgi:hypothetical protein
VERRIGIDCEISAVMLQYIHDVVQAKRSGYQGVDCRERQRTTIQTSTRRDKVPLLEARERSAETLVLPKSSLELEALESRTVAKHTSR